MIFELLGYALSSLIVAVLLAFKISNDIYPRALKKRLIRIAVSNWQKKLVSSFSTYDPVNAKCIEDLGIFASQKDHDTEQPEDVGNSQAADDLLFYGMDSKSNCLVVKMTRHSSNYANIDLYIKINGKMFSKSYSGASANGHEFHVGNLKLEMNEPMRSWRIWYNGAIEQRDTHGKDNMVHAVINILWKSIEVPFDSMKNANTNLISEYLTGVGAFGEKFSELTSILSKGYYQFGSYHGTIKIDNVDSSPLYLYGFRVRSIFNVADIQKSNAQEETTKKDNVRLEMYGNRDSDGNVFRLSGLCDGWTDGYVMKSSYFVKSILHVDDSPDHFLRNTTLPKLISFSDDEATYRVEIWPAVDFIKFPNLEVVQLKLSINGESGTGILLRKSNSGISHCSKGTMGNVMGISNTILESFQMGPEQLDSREAEVGKDIVGLDSEYCKSVSLVGGKGASLAQLATLGRTVSEFKTAKGFCVTTEAFRKSINLQKVSALFAEQECKLDEVCNEIMDLIKSSDTEKEISVLIKGWLEKTFGNSLGDIRFAVRSSGTLEDDSDLSCAGQNETFLGVIAENVPKKIVECWASLFTPQSVHYRLNHGQPAVSEMGVVIQEMVNAKVAGVLFSADPLNGNPFEMIITANFGLGESVVSASTDPDTFTVLRSRKSYNEKSISNVEQDLSIGKKNIGSKKTKIVLNASGNTTEEIVLEEDAANYCLSDEQILKLGTIAIKIESVLGQLKHVDIEWAIGQNGEIYILQSRAITSLDSWTEFELRHEFDSPLRSPMDCYTTANTGEVMPNTMSTLSIGLTARLLDIVIQNRMHARTGDTAVPHMMRRLACCQQRVLLNMLTTIYRSVDKEITPALVCVDLSIYGHKVIDENILKKAIKRYGVETGTGKLKNFILAIKGLMDSKNKIKLANDKFGKYHFEYKNCFGDLRKLYDRISEEIIELADVMDLHSCMSETSSLTQVFAFLILSGGQKVEEWDNQLFDDESKLLSVRSDVESADIPTAMEELADKILNHGENLEVFIGSTETKQAIEWIKKQEVLHTALEKFFDKHGHRCSAELDIGAKSWQTDPTSLMTLLKNIVRNKVAHKDTWTAPTAKQTYSNDDDLLTSLKTPLSNTARRLLKFLLPSFRNSVLNRERTKSLLVKTADQIKKAYYRLAELMVLEKLIPDEEILFFITHPEIGQLIRKDPNSARILYKAMRRRKLFAVMNKDKFSEIMEGCPEPIDDSIEVELVDSITATPVSSGKVQGTVKVCQTVEEASEILNHGDILITHATDIAWSPFFPLLGGVVTELGGLISHGAVVAREYGLPCIVGATNATKIFKSGEQVFLDAGKGTLSKIKIST